MRIRSLVLVGSLALAASCSSVTRAPQPKQSAIAYGSADTSHSAVVSLLANDADGFSECSGIIVKVDGDTGYVLTAAHCCNKASPSILVQGTDYSVGIQYLGGVAAAPAYAVVPGSVYYDTKYNQNDHDFCMLKFSGATGAPTIALPSGSDGLTIGDDIEHVGYGVTDTSTDNTVRRIGVDSIADLTSLTIGWDQGGAGHTPGTCEGDSGGPALVPVGAAQSAQTVVGITSYGNSMTCSLSTIGVASRVTSELGATGFITKFLADAPIGTKAAAFDAPSCDTCTGSASISACSKEADYCTSSPKCSTLIDCLNACTTDACSQGCTTTAGATATKQLIDFYQCVCESSACKSLCECPGAGVDLAKTPKDLAKAPADLGASDDLSDPNADLYDPQNDPGTGHHGSNASGCAVGGDPASTLPLLFVAALLAAGRRRSAQG